VLNLNIVFCTLTTKKEKIMDKKAKVLILGSDIEGSFFALAKIKFLD